jgi:hypothetical protein
MIYSFALNPAFDDMQLQMEVNGPIWATALASTDCNICRATHSNLRQSMFLILCRFHGAFSNYKSNRKMDATTLCFDDKWRNDTVIHPNGSV